jgi:hypothetical protein
MKQPAKLRFIENEVKTQELFSEFYLKKNIVASLLCDKNDRSIKRFTVEEELFHKGEYVNSIDVTSSFLTVDKKVLVDLMFDAVKECDMDRNFFDHF